MRQNQKIAFLLLSFLGLSLLSKKRLFSSLTKKEMNLENSSLAQELASFIAKHEGKVNTPYRDQAGKWTIGIGHLIKPNEGHLKETRGITDKQVLELFKKDSAWALKGVSDFVKVPLTVGQTVALTSFVFNFGVPAFLSSTLLKKLNAGLPASEVAPEFKKWVYITDATTGKKVVSNGLVNRRADEAKKFLS